MRVLHVTESYVGAGVSRVIESIVNATPEVEHHLLWAGDAALVRASEHLYSSLDELPHGQLQRIRKTRSVVADLQPDLVHAHSSWAGLYTRARTLDVPVVYQPHCYKFDDRQEHPVLRTIYRQAEKVMTRRTAITVALCEHERSLAQSLSASARVEVVPNTPTIPASTRTGGEVANVRRVVMIGRVCSQKDPAFFAEVSRLVRRVEPRISFQWIGDGEPGLVADLRTAEIDVTGWLSSDRIRSYFDETSLYFHSARYEGFPVSVLDAAALGAPVLVRDIPSFRGTDLMRYSSAEDAARGILEIGRDPRRLAEVRRGTDQLLKDMSRSEQRRALAGIYSTSSGARV